MQPVNGNVRQTTLSQHSPSPTASNKLFNTTRIQGLKNQGNGIVVRVPAGVKAINVRSMRGQSGSKVDLSKAESVKLTFNNTSNKDHFVTLRYDAQGHLHATVITDKTASSELEQTMNSSKSKIGIINGENRQLNEAKNLRILESVDGKFASNQVRFLKGIQLTNISSELSTLFKKFRAMTEKSYQKGLSKMNSLQKIERREQNSQQHQEQPKQPLTEETLPKKALKKISSTLNANSLRIEIIERAVADLTQKVIDTKKKQSRESKPMMVQRFTKLINKYQANLSLLQSTANLTTQEKREQTNILVTLFTNEKKRLSKLSAQLVRQKRSLNTGASKSNSEELNQEKHQIESQIDAIKLRILLINSLIREHGGLRALGRNWSLPA